MPEKNLLGAKLFNNIQTGFIEGVQGAFQTVQDDATGLLYVLAGLEMALFGLAWMIRQEEAFGLLIMKVFKIGLFFMFVTYFPALLNYLIQGFLREAYHVATDKGAIFLFHPGKVWEVGFKPGVSMMKLAVEYGTYNFGMSLIYLILGFGSLCMFAIIGAQIILTVVLFYLLMVLALIIIPLGLIKPMENFFYKAAQALFQAGARVFTIAVILGIAFPLWKTLSLKQVSADTGLEKPLALFFLTLVILFLCLKMPAIMARSIGKVGGNLFDGLFGGSSTSVTVSSSGAPSPSPAPAQPAGGQQSVAVSESGGASGAVSGSSLVAATTVVGSSGGSGGGGGGGAAAPAAASVTVSGGATGGATAGKGKGGGVGQASNVTASISKQTLSKNSGGVQKAMDNKDKKK